MAEFRQSMNEQTFILVLSIAGSILLILNLIFVLLIAVEFKKREIEHEVKFMEIEKSWKIHFEKYGCN